MGLCPACLSVWVVSSSGGQSRRCCAWGKRGPSSPASALVRGRHLRMLCLREPSLLAGPEQERRAALAPAGRGGVPGAEGPQTRPLRPPHPICLTAQAAQIIFAPSDSARAFAPSPGVTQLPASVFYFQSKAGPPLLASFTQALAFPLHPALGGVQGQGIPHLHWKRKGHLREDQPPSPSHLLSPASSWNVSIRTGMGLLKIPLPHPHQGRGA